MSAAFLLRTYRRVTANRKVVKLCARPICPQYRGGGICRNSQSSHHYCYGRQSRFVPLYVLARHRQSALYQSYQPIRPQSHFKEASPEVHLIAHEEHPSPLYWNYQLVHSTEQL